MRAGERRLSIYVNENALRAWLSSAKTVNRPSRANGAARSSEDGCLPRPSIKDDNASAAGR